MLCFFGMGVGLGVLSHRVTDLVQPTSSTGMLIQVMSFYDMIQHLDITLVRQVCCSSVCEDSFVQSGRTENTVTV